MLLVTIFLPVASRQIQIHSLLEQDAADLGAGNVVKNSAVCILIPIQELRIRMGEIRMMRNVVQKNLDFLRMNIVQVVIIPIAKNDFRILQQRNADATTANATSPLEPC